MQSPTSELKSEILRAGAGAGKTTRLVQEFVEFYDSFKKSNNESPRIIVTTFTRKATHELKERLLQKAIERNDNDLFTYISQKSRVHISTIHGVLALFIRQQGFKIGLSPDFKLISSLEDLHLQKRILKKVLSANSQFAVLLEEYTVGELLQVLELACEHFIISPENKYADLETMQKQSQELLNSHISKLLKCASSIESESPPEKWLEYLLYFKRLRTLPKDDFFKAFDEAQSVVENAGSKPAFRKATPPFNPELNEMWTSALDELKDFVADPFFAKDFWERWFPIQKIFNDFAIAYFAEIYKAKITNSQLTMGDLEILSAFILRQSPDSGTHFARNWNYWMIDEYQDTSPLQVYLLKNLIQDRPQFIVGDPQQSIYLFRGARSEVFDKKIDEFKKAKHAVSEQLDNYRSRTPVLNVINDTFTQMSKQFKSMSPKKDWESSWPACEILISDSVTDVKDKGTPSVSPDEEVDVSQLELSLALNKISDLLAKGVAAEKIAVLSRNNRNLEKLGHLAKKFGIAYQQPNAAGYFLKREIKDATSILKFLLNPHDNKHLVSCFRSPWFYIEDMDLILACQNRSISLWKSILAFFHEKKFKTEATYSVIETLKKYLELAREQGISQTLTDIFLQHGLIDSAEMIDPSGRREANLWKFISALKEKEQLGDFYYLDFLNEVESLVKSEDEGEAAPVIQPQRVNFMTVHASKGLQFDHVIIIGLSDRPRYSISPAWCFNENQKVWSLSLRNLDSRQWIHSPQTKEQTKILKESESSESERVFYVAMTRAKESITLVMNNKIKNGSWAEKLSMELKEGENIRGDYNYLVKKYSTLPKMDLANESSKNKTDLVFPEKFAGVSSKKLKVNAVTSILDEAISSSLLQSNVNSNSDSIAPYEHIKKSQYGTDLHRLFESLKYLSAEEIIRLYNNETTTNILNYFQTLTSPPLLNLIEVGHVEFGFEVLNDEKNLIRGQIDLWGKLDNEVWIIDYKTGSSNYLEKAYQQLHFYAQALKKIYQWDDNVKINLAVLYPLQRECFARGFNEN